MTGWGDSLAMVGGEPLPALDCPFQGLVRRVRGGDHAAFEALMRGCEQRVLGIAWRILADRDLARDAAQETFLRVFRSLDSFRLGEPFQPWVARIAAHVCYDLARHRRAHAWEGLEDEGPSFAPDAEQQVEREQQRRMVRRALQGLSPAERSALVLRELEGFSTEEVADALGVRPVTIRTQVAAARTKLRAFCGRVLGATTAGRREGGWS